MSVQNESIFHINPRFDIRQIYRSTCTEYRQNIQNHGNFPFYKGQSFEILISSEHHNYKVLDCFFFKFN